MPISGSLHDLHLVADGSVDSIGASLPDGSLGHAIFGVLNLPGALIATAEFIVEGFGS